MDLSELRNKIDQIDIELVKLFVARMDIAAQVADYKQKNNLPIYVPERERAILQNVAEQAGPEMDDYAQVLYSMLFELSRSYQRKRNAQQTDLYKELETTPKSRFDANKDSEVV